MDQRALALQELGTAADLNAELRELKARSRLTYRQLEERAARHGELLPRSTLADVLRHGSVPRQELLAAFVRACGEGDYVDDWLAARQRAAEAAAEAQAQVPGSGASGSVGHSTGSLSAVTERGSLRRLKGARRTRVAAVSLLAVALIIGVTWSLWGSGGSGKPADPAGSVSTSISGSTSVRPPHGHVLLRPLSSPGLCVTDGQVPDGRYGSLVAVQRPCNETAPQTTTLDPAGKDAYRISWYRPDQGKGCLKALTSGPGKGLLEPWEACERTTSFRFVPTRSGASGTGASQQAGTSEETVGQTYLIQIADGTCLGIRAASTAAGTEAVAEPCKGTDSQLFIIETVP
ncbi:RICIN domain-containing protein [Streptomyces sp. NPDC101160]|uniref:RICIN domain-containing protein n=1 Tax=Streptomyces sp. NPDC101160 TaxID=3366118 RepID=UPI0037F6F487